MNQMFINDISGKICFIGAFAKGDFILVKVVPSSLKKTMLSPVGIIRLSPNLPQSDLSIYKPSSLAIFIKRRHSSSSAVLVLCLLSPYC